jgi:hypothetical protein
LTVSPRSTFSLPSNTGVIDGLNNLYQAPGSHFFDRNYFSLRSELQLALKRPSFPPGEAGTG